MAGVTSGARPRVDPAAVVPLELRLDAAGDLPPADLVLTLGDGWSVIDAGGATLAAATDGSGPELRWPVDGMRSGETRVQPLVVQAPDPRALAGTPTLRSTVTARLVARDPVPVSSPDPSPSAAPAPSPDPAASPVPVVALTTSAMGEPVADPALVTEVLAPPLDVLVAPRVVIAHSIGTAIDPESLAEMVTDTDAPLAGLQRYDTFRLRFQLRNADSADTALQPRLEVREAGTDAWRPVGTSNGGAETVFALDPGWVADPSGDGTRPGPEQAVIDPSDLALAERDDPAQAPVAGRRIATDLPDLALALPALTITEVEYVLEPGGAARFGATYEFRITDAGEPLADARVARATMRQDPGDGLTPGQHQGVPVGGPGDPGAETAALVVADDPATALVAGFSAAAGIRGRPELAGSGTTPPSHVAISYALAADPVPEPAIAYPLTMKEPLAAPAAGTWDAPTTTPHADRGADASCAACHRAHTSQATQLQILSGTDGSICFQCHDGSGSNLDTRSQYTDAAVPANDAGSRSTYRHDAQAASAHTRAGGNEFGGRLNRHSACADCHDSHNATSGPSVQTASGWTVPPAAKGNTVAVQVSNGAAGSTPGYYTLRTPTYEYQLCFKCHSGYTVLPANTDQPLSRYSLDKGVELNPANVSFHPVEAKGTNATTAMANSLAGTSPYKLWNFSVTSTVRCVHCHGDPRKYSQTAKPDAGGDLAPHTSQYRGLLLQGYQDRVLNGRTDDPYDAADFALCYLCHAEAPFTDTSGDTRTDTNFRYHGKHVSRLMGRGNSGTDIDTPGAGGGNAICAECHYRIHSTATKQGGQGTYARLVNFSPNVTGLGDDNPPLTGAAWDQSAKSCTLTCHSQGHDPKRY